MNFNSRRAIVGAALRGRPSWRYVRRAATEGRPYKLLFMAVFLASAITASGSVRAIWAVNDGEKIERDDLNNANKAANSSWDGHKVTIFGARNEVIAFQLIVETD